MIPVTQTKVVVKNSKDEMIVRGNCYAACIASILEKTIDEVPNVETLFHIEGSYWFIVMHAYLNSIGWMICTDEKFKCFHTIFTDDNYSELDSAQAELKDKYYLVSGLSPRGVQHMCIYQNGKLVHDPHPTREGLISVEYFEELIKVPK